MNSLHPNGWSALEALCPARVFARINFDLKQMGDRPAVAARSDALVLDQVALELEVMLASATPLGDEVVQGYQIKTGALHRIIGLVQGSGRRVIVPLLPSQN